MHKKTDINNIFLEFGRKTLAIDDLMKTTNISKIIFNGKF